MSRGSYRIINALCCVVESWGDRLECRGESMGGGVRFGSCRGGGDGRDNTWHLLGKTKGMGLVEKVTERVVGWCGREGGGGSGGSSRR